MADAKESKPVPVESQNSEKESGSKSTSKFCGEIFGGPGVSDNATKDRAMATVGFVLNQERNATKIHVWMALFTGADCPKISYPSGAYSVVSYHGKFARMAWYMPASSPEVVNEKRLSGLAVAQALYIADERLRFLPDDLKPKKATIKVFVSCVETLNNIDDPSTIEGDGREAQLEVVKLIEKLTHSLCNIVGINVRVYLQWLPGTYAKMKCARDFAKRCRRKTGRKNAYFVGNEEMDVETIPEGISAFIEEQTAEDGDTRMTKESEAALERPDATVDVVMEDALVEIIRPAEGQVGVGQEITHNEEKLDEAEATASGQVLSNLQVSKEKDEKGMNNEVLSNDELSNDEESLVDQQIFADFYEHQIPFRPAANGSA
ncbi:hypothetical protein QBC32DRAFT_327858 [Pseudoneurospora amorphoporcata]|uniref:Uncharacterized protein n=1 Tax=Pseudoneurospora amorphoporcata TaxID=241081 RepID=A0AAN6NP20_9PEZI|nr:hypothetical protein QBC32DRAFT_327858 [Pseudoneurospora amorphoporcata]